MLAGSVKFGEFNLKSGIKSNFYIDCRPLVLHYESRKLIAKAMSNFIDNSEYIVSTGVGGSYIASAISDMFHNDIIHVRSNRKDHGIGNQVEFPYGFDPSKGFVIVDDVLTFGTSILLSINALQEINIVPNRCVVLVDREEGGRTNIKSKIDIEICSIFTKSDLKNYYQ